MPRAIRILWARFRRLWFHIPVHMIAGKPPRFPRCVDGFARDADGSHTLITCECGAVFFAD